MSAAELYGLVRAHGSAVDWLANSHRMEAHGLARQLQDHLWLAHRFGGMALPEGDSDWRARRHELRVLASFSRLAGAPAEKLRFAFGAAYVDSLYGHRDRPLALAWARARTVCRPRMVAVAGRCWRLFSAGSDAGLRRPGPLARFT